MLWHLVHRSGDPADASSSGELLDGVDDSLVTLGYLTILFWLPKAGSLFTPPMSARPVAPGLAVQLQTRSSWPWIACSGAGRRSTSEPGVSRGTRRCCTARPGPYVSFRPFTHLS